MQAPDLAQPDKRASLQRDRGIWADECIRSSLREHVTWRHSVRSAQIARSRMRDLISAFLGRARPVGSSAAPPTVERDVGKPLRQIREVPILAIGLHRYSPRIRRNAGRGIAASTHD
jgi:hypothetical protein